MPQYKAPLRDIRFLFHDLLDYPAHYTKLPNGAEATPDMVDSILEECAKLGVTMVVAPDGTRARAGGPRVTGAETLRQALHAALEPSERSAAE